MNFDLALAQERIQPIALLGRDQRLDEVQAIVRTQFRKELLLFGQLSIDGRQAIGRRRSGFLLFQFGEMVTDLAFARLGHFLPMRGELFGALFDV